MKTTIELPDELAAEVKRYAAEHELSMRQVFERAVRQFIGGRGGPRFKMRIVTTQGEGLVEPGHWESIRSKIYEGQGG